MEQGPVSCLPNATKMSKAKKVLDEAREIRNPELDLVDKGISSFEETPGLRKWNLLYEAFTKFGILIGYIVGVVPVTSHSYRI